MHRTGISDSTSKSRTLGRVELSFTHACCLTPLPPFPSLVSRSSGRHPQLFKDPAWNLATLIGLTFPAHPQLTPPDPTLTKDNCNNPPATERFTTINPCTDSTLEPCSLLPLASPQESPPLLFTGPDIRTAGPQLPLYISAVHPRDVLQIPLNIY
ncbi:hypothetical protein DFH06DRAFT_1479187 [Mycena polygramma]|nr:hypothetical protein DFH06DRAFT_1479187 [Mycena polygramma]